MAKKKRTRKKTVETLVHEEDTRYNIPTAELQSVVEQEVKSPIRVAYERRNRDLDPQLVWCGKDEQDWSDSSGGSVDSGKHRRRVGKDGDGGISSVPERGKRLAGRGGDISDSGSTSEPVAGRSGGNAAGPSGGNQPHARWPQAVAAIEAQKPSDFPLSLTTSHYAQVTIHGVDVFHPNTGEVRSDGAEGIACWFIDSDYNEESFFVRQAYFLGANDPYKSLKTTLKAEINEDAWATLHSDASRPFDKPKSGRIAVKVINHLGDEVMKVFRI